MHRRSNLWPLRGDEENAKALPLAQAHIRLGVQDEPGPRGVPILPVREGDELQERQEAFLHHLEALKQ